jgi:3-oxoacyl-[acyl-carrier protein] reductase
MKVEDGCLLIRSGRTAVRYIGEEGRTLLRDDGFVNTGDSVERRGDRYYFTGRRDGVINVGGQKVHPEEVEAVINRHPSVAHCLVKSQKNPIMGAIIVADVVLSKAEPNALPAERRLALQQDILQSCRTELPKHKVPALISRPAANWLEPMRNVIVTGASRGLGLAISQALAGAGYSVVAVARKTTAEFDAVVARAEGEAKGTLAFVPFDLSEIDGIAQLVSSIRSDFGAIYGLVNNAALGTEGVLANMHNTEIEKLVRLNTLSPIVLTKFAMRAMMAEGKGGRIVNIASIIGFTGYSGLSAYGATKASMIGFTRSLAREAGRLGITVNAVAPGFVATEMTSGMSDRDRDRIAQRSALRRLAEPQDVANSVEFLMSEKARNITGTVLTVDAGNTA